MTRLLAVVSLITVLATAGCAASTSSSVGAGVRPGPGDASFYRPPSPPPGARPGDLMWAHQVAGPPGGTGWVIIYWSSADDGHLVPVSAVLLVPNERPATAPVISWAHGTSGLGDNCAPSLASFGSGPAGGSDGPDPILERLYETGAIVAATDYRGLGTPGEHPFLANELAGRDVLDAVRAAHRFVGSAGPPAAVIGQSQGGSAALYAAQIQPRYAPELDLRGAVGMAVPYELGELAAGLDDGPYVGYVMMTVTGYLHAYPGLAAAGGKLSPVGREVMTRISGQCTDVILGALAGRPESEYGMTAVLADAAFKAELARNDVGVVSPRVPVLIVQGLADDLVRPDRTRDLVRRYCGAGASVVTREYPGAGHVDVRQPAMADVLPFLGARLTGVPVGSTCPVPG